MIPFYLSSYDPGDAYTVLLNNGQPFVYFLALTCHHALAAALYGGMGMLVSAFVRRDLVGKKIYEGLSIVQQDGIGVPRIIAT